MIVGEAPGAHEETNGAPFMGPSGAIVDECLYKAGLSRSEVYATNVVKIRPPNNEIKRLGELGRTIEDFLPELWNEIKEINPNCILTFGNTALEALTGEKGVNNFRGSILPNKRTITPKVVATIHPASLLHKDKGGIVTGRERTFIEFDVVRAVKQSLTRDYRPPSRNLIVARNSLDLYRFIERHTNLGRRHIVHDIETFKAIPMCIGFAFSRYEALSVPLFNIASPTNPDGWHMHDLCQAWKYIADILMDDGYKLIGHNLKFDQSLLEKIGLSSCWPYFDTQLGFHTMYPELPKKLAFVSSVLTEEPYYKDDLEEYNPKKEKLEKRLIYNARDCAVEFEVYEKEVAELTEMGLLDWYFENQHPKHKFYYNMEKRGFARDSVAQMKLIKKYERYTRMIHNQTTKDLGFELNVNSNGENGQVYKTLFNILKCPKRRDTSEDTLMMLMLNAVKDEKRRRIISNILKERKARKTTGTYVKAIPSLDGKFHTTYNITGTETNRTSTSKPKPPVVAEAEGLAFQTLTKHGDVGADLRTMFVCSPGKILMEADMSACQARIVAHLSRDSEAMKQMNRKDFKVNKFGVKDDIHTWTAMLVTETDFAFIDDEIRQLGKKTRHAGNFGMGKRRLSEMAQISEWRAGKCLLKFHEANPNIANVFWAEVQQALADNDMKLTSPSGGVRLFFDRWGEEMFKEAYAHLPQVTEADHVKAAGIRIEARAPWIEFILESHDSLLAEIPDSDSKIQEAAQIFREELEVPIDFSRCSLPRGPLVIPCDIQISKTNWKHMRKYKG